MRTEPNVRFYRQLGFDAVDQTRIEGGPQVWAMLRPPDRSSVPGLGARRQTFRP